MSSKKFKIVIPADISKSKDGEWRVKGLASTASRDQQGEIMLQDGMDLTPIDNKKGIINWDHKKGPENTLGVLDGYTRASDGLYIEGRLFKNHDKAKAAYQIMSSLGKSDYGRMGLSVEGQIKERAGENGEVIKRSVITGVALTMNPVNTDTYVDLTKSLSADDSEIEFQASEEAFAISKQDSGPNSASSEVQNPLFTADQVLEIMCKALAVGSNYATQTPGQLSGGAALAQEDLDKKKKDAKTTEKGKMEVEAEVENGKKEIKVEMDSKDFKEEHKRIADTLKQEAETQQKELNYVKMQEKKIKKGSSKWFQKSILDAMDALKTLYPDVPADILLRALEERLNTRYGVKASN